MTDDLKALSAAATPGDEIETLPPRHRIAPVKAVRVDGSDWPVCWQTGYSNDADQDWGVVTDSVPASAFVALDFPIDAKDDARVIAKLINDYRKGDLKTRAEWEAEAQWLDVSDLPPSGERPGRCFVVVEGHETHHGDQWFRARPGIARTTAYGFNAEDVARIAREDCMDEGSWRVTHWMKINLPPCPQFVKDTPND